VNQEIEKWAQDYGLPRDCMASHAGYASHADCARDQPPDLAGGGKPETGGTMTPLDPDREIVGDAALALRFGGPAGYPDYHNWSPPRLTEGSEAAFARRHPEAATVGIFTG
jgi:hypothetical protein